jgi:uncharacterized protein
MLSKLASWSVSTAGPNTTQSRAEIGKLQKSSHLVFAKVNSPTPIIYHALYGNLAVVDEEVVTFLRSSDGPSTFSDFVSRIGTHVAQQLWNHYFLVSDPGEERREIREELRKREQLAPSGYFVTALQISASNACNFACSYCFADTSDKRSTIRTMLDSGPKNVDFTVAAGAIRETLALARSHGHEQIVVKFLGREPLVNWRVIRELLHQFEPSEVRWAVTTNGALITEDIANDMRDFNIFTVVSLDGPPETHDTFRILKAGGSTYDLVMRGMLRLQDASVPYGVSAVLSSATDLRKYHRFCDDVASAGASELELNLAMQTNFVRVQQRYRTVQELGADLVDIYRYADGRIHLHGDWIDPFHRILTTHKERGRDLARPLGSACSATSHQLSLEPSGDLFPCRAMSTHYGHISDLRSALTSSAYRNVAMRTFYNVPHCSRCVLEGFCQGTCLGSSEESSGDIYNPQVEYCDVYRLVTELLLNIWRPAL